MNIFFINYHDYLHQIFQIFILQKYEEKQIWFSASIGRSKIVRVCSQFWDGTE